MMATRTLISQRSTTGITEAAVALVPGVTRATYVLTLTGPAAILAQGYAQATILASNDGSGVFLPIHVMNIIPGGPTTVSQTVSANANHMQYTAQLTHLAPGGFSATLTQVT